jgi:hypothetical protein
MKVLVALMAALALVLSHSGAVRADGRYEGFVIVDGAPCYAGVDDTETDIWLPYNLSISIFPAHVAGDRQLIGYSDGSSDAPSVTCWVLIDTISPGIGEPPIIEPVEPQGTIIREDFINADDVLCRYEPSFDGDVVAKLFQGDVVGIYDVVVGDWQKVGLEATSCYVWYEFVGPQAQPEEPTAEPTEVAGEDESPAIEPTTPDTNVLEEEEAESASPPIEPVNVGGVIVTRLPSAGSGDAAEDDYGWENLTLESFGGIVLVIVFFGGGSLLVLVVWKFISEHHLTERAKEARKNILRYFS